MGYMSNVGITLYKKDYEDMKTAAEKTGDKYISEFVDSFEVYETGNKDVIQLGMTFVKWYKELDEIKFVRNFLKDKPYRFLRVGELMDDIEDDVNKEDIEEAYEMWVERKIRFYGDKYGEGL
nr:MAG TPA: hypothetical protein [Caudoviricetes sp.]